MRLLNTDTYRTFFLFFPTRIRRMLSIPGGFLELTTTSLDYTRRYHNARFHFDLSKVGAFLATMATFGHRWIGFSDISPFILNLMRNVGLDTVTLENQALVPFLGLGSW
jgi:hypothetical protein